MDRPFWYYGPVLRDTDLLNAARFPMVGLGKLAEAVLGSGIATQGFAVAPTVPASMSVNIGPGQVYQLANLEATQWAAFGPDSHSIVKQGISLDAQTQTLVAPTASGYAQNFLIQVAYADQDQGSTVLPYYNSAYPTQPYNGPGNSGASQNTIRAGVANLTVKAGTAANAGQQTTPTPDAGYAGLYVVTLTQGQTTITAGNIAVYANAPFIPVTLPGVPSGAQSGAWTYVEDSGVTNAAIVAPNPALVSRTKGMRLFVRFAGPNTSTSPTINDGLGTAALLRSDGTAPASGDFSGTLALWWDGAAYRARNLTPSERATQTATVPAKGSLLNVQVFTAPGTSTYTPTSGTTKVYVTVVGGGGAGGGGAATGSGQSSTGSGGGASCVGRALITSSFAGVAVTVGAGGVGGLGPTGGGGGTSSFGTLATAPGGGGGVIVAATSSVAVSSYGPGSATPGFSGPGMLLYGMPGGPGLPGMILVPGSVQVAGSGAVGYLGFGGGAPTIGGTGGNGGGYGGGGGGGCRGASQSAVPGANGANGIVIVEEYA